jgi:alkylation response protein AidB-like acyl-CoA dehydrogenase
MSGRPDPADPGITVTVAHNAFVLSGSAAFVPEAQAADLVVVVARHDSGGSSLFLVERSDLDVRMTPAVDPTRRLAQVSLVDVEVPASALLGVREGAATIVDGLINRMAVALACDSLGGARRMMEMTAAYTRERVQFGRAIGTFQAVKHRAADMVVDVEASDVAVEKSLSSFHGDERGDPEYGSMATVYANDAYARVAGGALQLHGGIGFTWEHDTHLFLKRAKLNQAMFGDAAWHRKRLAAAVLAR